MKRFTQPVVPSCRLPKPLANRVVAVGSTLLVIVSFLQAVFAAAPLLPKREIPQRTPSQAVPNTTLWANSARTTSDSLIQVVYDEEEPEKMVPPPPPLRKPWEAAELPVSPGTALESEPFLEADRDDFEEENSFFEEELPEFVDFLPLDTPQYELPAVTESPADFIPQTFSPPQPLQLPQVLQSPQSPPLPFVSDPSGGNLASVPLTMNTLPQGAPAMLGQIPHQAAYNHYVANPYGYTPYNSPQTGTAYVNPYGYGPYGYPNAPGAYWGPTGFTANPYVTNPYVTNPYAPYSQVSYPGYPNHPGYPGYPPPYGVRPVNQVNGDDRSDSLSSTTWETLGYFNPLKSPKGPNRGVGGPLMMRSWRDRPFYLGAFGGCMSGSELVSGLVDQGYGGTGGILFGWYADNYWGLESRLHFAGLPGKNTAQGQEAYEQWYQLQNETEFVPPIGSRNNAVSMFDVSIHYYPLGNAKWRPYLKLGLGTANQKFRDMYGEKRDYNSFMIPWGIGLKYWWNERIALQMELTDNVIFAVEEAKTQNNVALTVGLNFPIGKIKRKDPVIYWPMVPSSGP